MSKRDPDGAVRHPGDAARGGMALSSPRHVRHIASNVQVLSKLGAVVSNPDHKARDQNGKPDNRCFEHGDLLSISDTLYFVHSVQLISRQI